MKTMEPYHLHLNTQHFFTPAH